MIAGTCLRRVARRTTVAARAVRVFHAAKNGEHEVLGGNGKPSNGIAGGSIPAALACARRLHRVARLPREAADYLRSVEMDPSLKFSIHLISISDRRWYFSFSASP